MNDRRRRTIPLILLVIALYVGWVVLGTEINIYQVKTAAKAACQQSMVFGAASGLKEKDRVKVRLKALTRIRSHDVTVEDEGLRIEMRDPCSLKGCTCDFEVEYTAESKWPFLSDFFETLPTWKREGKKTGSIDYKAFY